LSKRHKKSELSTEAQARLMSGNTPQNATVCMGGESLCRVYEVVSGGERNNGVKLAGWREIAPPRQQQARQQQASKPH
jgi:hypothetical protein